MTHEEAIQAVEEAEMVNTMSPRSFEEYVLSDLYVESMTSDGYDYTSVPEVY